MRRCLLKIALFLGLGLLLPLAALAVMTQPAISISTIELTAFAYDAVVVQTVSGNALTGSEVSPPLIPSLGQDLKIAAAESTVTIDENAIRFSQSNVRSSLPELTQSMKTNGWQGAPLVPASMAPDI